MFKIIKNRNCKKNHVINCFSKYILSKKYKPMQYMWEKLRKKCKNVNLMNNVKISINKFNKYFKNKIFKKINFDTYLFIIPYTI